MRAFRSLTVGLVLAFVLAGCIGTKDDGARGTTRLGGRSLPAAGLGFVDGWAELALPDQPGHNHRDPKQHENLSTPNFEVVGYDPLITDYYGKTAGMHGCGDTKELNGRRIGVVHAFGTDLAFVIFDVTNPAQPKKIGELAMMNTHVYDVAITADLKNVLLATSPLDAGPDLPEGDAALPGPPATFRDACTGAVRPVAGPEAGLPYASGVVLVDIENPRNPAITDFRPFPVLGGHSVVAGRLGNRDLVLASVPNGIPGLGYYVFMEIQGTAAGKKLVPLSIYQFPGTSVPGTSVKVSGDMHDAYLAVHPITKQNLAYLAYGGQGLVIVNIDDPRNPRLLSHWADWGVVGDAAPPIPFVHEALPAPEAWDGRHYTWIGEECISRRAKTPSCLVFGLDTTDPAKPAFVGAWTLPVDVQWSRGLEFSLHYLGLQNRTLFATSYHGGVWAIDVSNEESRAAMPSIGVFLPTKVSPQKFSRPPRSALIDRLFAGYALDGTPTVLDLNVLSDGTLVVFDLLSGLYTVKFDASNPAPAPPPWPLGKKA